MISASHVNTEQLKQHITVSLVPDLAFPKTHTENTDQYVSKCVPQIPQISNDYSFFSGTVSMKRSSWHLSTMYDDKSLSFLNEQILSDQRQLHLHVIFHFFNVCP